MFGNSKEEVGRNLLERAIEFEQYDYIYIAMSEPELWEMNDFEDIVLEVIDDVHTGGTKPYFQEQFKIWCINARFQLLQQGHEQ